ncbi:6616_t:CDS:2, partial [Entrophospora sp. SA101]
HGTRKRALVDITNQDNLKRKKKSKSKDEFDIEIDLLIETLNQEQIQEWVVDTIDISKRFKSYQQSVIMKFKNDSLSQNDTYEILSLASIIVLCKPCPYQTIFSDDEWNLVIEKSPFVIQGSIIPDTVSTIVHNAARKQTINQDSYIIANKDPLCRSAAQIFNGLRQTLPMTSPVKTTEDEHCNKFLNVYINNVFTAQKRYEVKFNCSLLESMQRPDFLCTIDDVPFLISEIKPLGTSPLLKKNDFKKAHLRAKDAVNQQLNKKYGPGKVVLLINAGNSLKSFIMDQYNGMYRSWGYMTTKLATDIPDMSYIITIWNLIEYLHSTEVCGDSYK